MSSTLVFLLAFGAMGAAIVVSALGLRRSGKQARLNPAAEQELDITVNGSYSPDAVVVKEGIPVRLNFIRNEDNPCSEWVIFSEFQIRRRLPAYKTTAVVFTPNKQGEFLFTCQLGMYRGKLIVQKGDGRRGRSG